MELKEIIVLSSSVVGVIMTFFCQESIKKFIGNFFDNLSKPQINILFLLFLISVFAIPWGINTIIPNGLNTSEKSNLSVNNSETTINEAPKTEPEVWLEAGEKGTEIIQNIAKNNQKKNSEYETNRDQRWVFQIGDWGDDEVIAKLYKEVKHIGNVCVFKDRKKYCLFKNEEYTSGQLKNSLNVLRTQINNTIRVDTIDLMEYTDRKKRNMIHRLEKLGKRKDKVEIDCYYVSK